MWRGRLLEVKPLPGVSTNEVLKAVSDVLGSCFELSGGAVSLEEKLRVYPNPIAHETRARVEYGHDRHPTQAGDPKRSLGHLEGATEQTHSKTTPRRSRPVDLERHAGAVLELTEQSYTDLGPFTHVDGAHVLLSSDAFVQVPCVAIGFRSHHDGEGAVEASRELGARDLP